ALDGEGAGTHHDLPAADAHAADLDDGALGVVLARGELVRLRDQLDAVNAGEALELVDQGDLLRVDHPEHGDDLALHARVHERREPLPLDRLDHVLERLGTGAGLHDDDHSKFVLTHSGTKEAAWRREPPAGRWIRRDTMVTPGIVGTPVTAL